MTVPIPFALSLKADWCPLVVGSIWFGFGGGFAYDLSLGYARSRRGGNLGRAACSNAGNLNLDANEYDDY
jgi:hypothetical protein